MTSADANIPQQTEGQYSDAIHFIDSPTQQLAHNLFLLAKNKLKDISQWHKYSGVLSSKFAVTDAQGNEVYKLAAVGDLFSIDLPGPGPLAGGGFEWVRIEAMDEVIDEQGDSEYITMTVTPVANPKHPDKSIAHFFDHHSTNTFIIERHLNRVTAASHGRNEKPNNTDTNIFDTVRNTLVALSAREGLSLPQWKSLMKGLLKI